MSKDVSEKVSLELTLLAALDSVHADVDTSEIAEIHDWSRAVREKFLAASIKGASRPSNLEPSVPLAIVTDAPGVSGVVLGTSSHMASYQSAQYSQIAIPQLISVCASESSEAAWSEFVRRFQPLITGVIVKVVRQYGKASADLVDDLVQEAFLKLCKDSLRALRSVATANKGAFFGFLKVIAANTARDYFRSAAAFRGGAAYELEVPESDRAFPEHESSRDISSDPERKILLAEIDTILKTHAREPNFERDYAIFWLYYSHGLTAKAISALPGIRLTVKGVESTLHRLTQRIRVALTQKGETASE